MPKSEVTFEKALEGLERIVGELESGDLALEKALARFEEGVRLSRYCASRLDDAERKITLLMENADGTLVETPFAESPAGPHALDEKTEGAANGKTVSGKTVNR